MGDWEAGASASGESPLGYHPCNIEVLTMIRISGFGTVSDGQFDWGGRLLKSNGGARRSSQNDWKPFKECKGKRRLDCESDGSSRYESRT